MKAIGIDLGTTNTVAAAGGADARVLASPTNESYTPSVVGYVRRRKAETGGEIVVGRQALNNAVRDPLNTVISVKRLMGRTHDDARVADVRRRYRYRLTDPPAAGDPDQGVRVMLHDTPYTPAEISALILRHVGEGARLALGEEVTHAVITVPAYFEERQRQATMDAGAAAGLTVLQIIDEPTAAAIAFGMGKERERHRVLVYDLGGGTFDISIIQMTAGQYSVLEIAGNNWLGGDDFDETLVRRMVDWVKAEYGYDPSGDVAFLTKAKIEAEQAKIALSLQQSHTISKPLMLIVPDVGGPVDLEMEVTRGQFEADIAPLVDETMTLVEQALANQHLDADDLTAVLLVGGSTAVPLVQERLFARFGQHKVKRHVHPMECVALGAGILATAWPLEGTAADADMTVEGPRVQSVTAMHLGIAAVKDGNPDAFVPIIPKGTPYPLREPKKRLFQPSEEHQMLISIPVYEGLNERASLNEQQGIIQFPLPEGLSMTTPVEVSFNYDSNRVTTVSIRVIGTEHSHTETLRRDRPRMRPAGPQTLVDDWREELQPSVRAGRHFLGTYGAYMDEADRKEIEEGIAEGEAALRSDNQPAGRQASLVLRNKILGSGTASLMFIADRAMHGLPADQSQLLAQAVSSLRTAHLRGNADEVQRLSSELRVVVAQLMTQQRSVQDVEDRKSYEGLLRVGDFL